MLPLLKLRCCATDVVLETGRTLPETCAICLRPLFKCANDETEDSSWSSCPAEQWTSTESVIVLHTCGHAFHVDCLRPALARSMSCPIDRRPLDVVDRADLGLAPTAPVRPPTAPALDERARLVDEQRLEVPRAFNQGTARAPDPPDETTGIEFVGYRLWLLRHDPNTARVNRLLAFGPSDGLVDGIVSLMRRLVTAHRNAASEEIREQLRRAARTPASAGELTRLAFELTEFWSVIGQMIYDTASDAVVATRLADLRERRRATRNTLAPPERRFAHTLMDRALERFAPTPPPASAQTLSLESAITLNNVERVRQLLPPGGAPRDVVLAALRGRNRTVVDLVLGSVASLELDAELVRVAIRVDTPTLSALLALDPGFEVDFNTLLVAATESNASAIPVLFRRIADHPRTLERVRRLVVASRNRFTDDVLVALEALLAEGAGA